jgi:hypothetical protein
MNYSMSLALLCFVGGLLTACKLLPGEPYDDKELALGLTAPEGAIEVLFNPCGSLAIEEVRLVEVKGGVIGDDDDIVLWEVRADGPVPSSSLSTFVLGKSRDRFTETVPMAESLPNKMGLLVFAGGRIHANTSFKVDDLMTGAYLNYKEKYVSKADFVAFDSCNF